MPFRLNLLTVACGVFMMTSNVNAEPIFSSFDVLDAQGSDVTRGYRFMYTGAGTQEVTGLGLFDLDALGIPGGPSDTIGVNLWDITLSGGSLVTPIASVEVRSGTQANVDSSGGPYTSSEPEAVGDIYFENLVASVFLSPGRIYMLTADYNDVDTSDNEFWANPVTLSIAPDFTILQAQSGFAFRTDTTAAVLTGPGANWGQVGNGNGDEIANAISPNEVIGPTLIFGSTSSVVPEPSSFIMLGTAIVGALAYRRRRKVA